jgi:hypothetical protein
MATTSEPELALRQEESELVLVPVQSELLATQLSEGRLSEGRDLAAGIVERVQEPVGELASPPSSVLHLRPLSIGSEAPFSLPAAAQSSEAAQHSQIEFEVEMYSSGLGDSELGQSLLATKASSARSKSGSRSSPVTARTHLKTGLAKVQSKASVASPQTSIQASPPSASVPDRLINFLAGLLKRIEQRIVLALRGSKRARGQASLQQSPMLQRQPRQKASIIARLLGRGSRPSVRGVNSSANTLLADLSYGPEPARSWLGFAKRRKRSVRGTKQN